MVLRISSIIGTIVTISLLVASVIDTIVTISLHVASVVDTIIAMILTTSAASKADTIVAVASSVVTRVTTAIIYRNIVAVAIEFGKLFFRRHQSVAPTVCYPPLVEFLPLPLLCGGEVITLA